MSDAKHDLVTIPYNFLPQQTAKTKPDMLFVVIGHGTTLRTVLARQITINTAVLQNDPANILNQGDMLVLQSDGTWVPVSSGTVTTGSHPQPPPQPAVTVLDPDRVKDVLDLLHIVADAADIILFERGQEEMNPYLSGLTGREKDLIVQLNHEFQVGTRALLALTFLLNSLKDVLNAVPNQSGVRAKIQEAVSMARHMAEGKK